VPERAEPAKCSTDPGVWRARNAYLHYRAARLCHESRELIATARASVRASGRTVTLTRSSLTESRLLLSRLRSR
jgi:hypothetical protein